MKVEVEASQIAALEQKVEQLQNWLVIAVARRKGKKLTITEVDFAKHQGGNIAFEAEDGKVTLTYKAAT